MKMPRRYWLSLLIAAGSLAVVGLAWLAMTRVAVWFDDISRVREETVVANGIAARTKEIEKLVVPNAIWDDAVRNLDHEPNTSWAHDNIGIYFSNVARFHAAAVLDSDDVVTYAMEDGAKVAPARIEPFVRAAGRLVARVRATENRLERRAFHGLAGANLREPIQATAPRNINNRVFLVTATLVQPDIGNVRVLRSSAPIILTWLEVGPSFAETFAQRYLLSEARFEVGDARRKSSEAQAGLKDETGAFVATLGWAPRRPGSEILAQIQPWLLAGLTFLIALALAQYYRAYRARSALLLSEQNATHIAAHDALTGLCNRADFELRLTAYSVDPAKEAESVAVLCIDADYFTEINDRFGHRVGDELLKAIADRLIEMSVGNAVCARFGGDGFAVLLPNCDLGRAEQFADAIVRASEKPFSLGIGEKHVTCSIGVAAVNPLPAEPLEVLRRADLALHQAKLDGRNCFRSYDAKLDSNFQLRGELAEFLRADIATGRLEVAYQPQVSASGELVGVEALVRWSTPEHGAIPPSLFVPLAEQAGLISDLGEYVLDKVLEDRRLWPTIKVAINLSASQLRDGDFARRVLHKLASSGARCADIELELTEGVLMAQDGTAADMLLQLREAGITIALDDFGTGYSSLSYLRKLPIDKIKIDRSFVSELGQAGADALVKAIVDLAHALNLSVLAEGVETPQQKLSLEAVGCIQMQGYLTGRPTSAAAIQELAAVSGS